MFYHGVKFGYSSPLTLTDQSTGVKRGEKGDLQVLRPHFITCVPVRISNFNDFIFIEIFCKTILHRIYKTINEDVRQSNFFQRQFFNLAYRIKVKRLESGLDSPYLDR
jgi:long-chain acyl-CoA synthetase